MSTSLAEQLTRLAVPQTTVLKRDKKRPSLLFDPKEAAGLKRETIYHIGLEGLDELISKNNDFSQFQSTLFHITSRDFVRSVENAEANENLDKNIKKFLLLLSPYFLLNCSHKALEWLINRYAINEFNRNNLLMLILPYHESNIFVRVLQLLDFKDSNDSFYFLKTLQKPGVHLPKQSLLNHAASNSGFLKFIGKYILELIKLYNNPNLLTVVFNFYCSVFTGAIEYSEEVSEDQVSQMLPFLLKGLNSSIPDFCAASYVITARLVAKSCLADKLLDRLVEKISELNVPGLKTESCLLLLVLYQSQKQYSNIPPIAVANLSEKEWLPKALQTLNNSGSLILPFLEKLVKRCSTEGTKNDLASARNLITNVLQQIQLDESYVAVILHSILDPLKTKMDYSEAATNWLTETVTILETQYPNSFDKEVCKILVSQDTMIKRKKCLSRILKNTMIYKEKFNVFEKLYHSNPLFRCEALTFLQENYNSLMDADKEIIKNSFIDRLNDDNVYVVQETILVVQNLSFSKSEDFRYVFLNLVKKCLKEEKVWWFEENCISKPLLKLLCTHSDSNDWEVFLTVFPFLLPKSAENLEYVKKFLQIPFFAENPLIKTVYEKLLDTESAQDFVKLLFESFENINSVDLVNNIVLTLNKISIENQKLYQVYIAFLILTSIMPKNCSVDISNSILDIFFHNYNSFTCSKSDTKEKQVVDYVETMIEGVFPVEGFLKCLEDLICKTKKPDINLRLADFSANNSQISFLAKLANVLINCNEQYIKTSTIFLDNFCSTWDEKFDFLLNLCISENKHLNIYFNTRVLNYLSHVLKNVSEEEFKKCIDIEKPASAYLLMLLSNTDVTIRKLVLEILEKFVEISTKEPNTYYNVLEGIKKYKEEIIMDHEQISLIMFNVIDTNNTKRKSYFECNHLLKFVCNKESPTYLKAGILKLLSHINKLNILEKIAKLALDIFDQDSYEIDNFEAIVLRQIICRIDWKVMKEVSFNTNTWKFLEIGIKNDKVIKVLNDNENKLCPSVLILHQLDEEIFTVFQEEILKQLLNIIIEVSSTSNNPEILPAAMRIFKHIDLDIELILDILIKMRDVQSPRQDITKKKRRISVVPTVDILDTLEWKKGLSILEFIQDKKKIRNINNLIPVLFEILKKCLDFDEQAAVEYPKQLVLSLILHCCQKMNAENLPENVFNMELIVQCIRASQNPQTHHHALLVLAYTAKLIPTQVLHHMMAIFTFMGSSVLRHDDAYSFQIIMKIVDTIIPILIESKNVTNIARVLRVFVDALLDVPEHRRMPLYKQLLERVHVKDNLFVFLLLVFEAQVIHNNQGRQKRANDLKRLDIVANVCCQFSPEVILYNFVKLIRYLNDLPDEKVENMETDAECYTFNIGAHTPKDFRHYKYVLLRFTANFLASQEFVNKVAALNSEEELSLEDLFKDIIVNILQYIQRTSKIVDKSVNTPQAQYWKVILHHSYDILDSINALVTAQMFILITKGLMVHNLSAIRRRVLELLNNKLQFNSEFFSECDKYQIYSLIPPVVSIIDNIDNQLELEQETVIQTALLSLKLLIKFLAPSEPEKFVPILEFITRVIKSRKAENNVLASVLLCLAELCVNLRAHAIACIADFMPALLKILKRQKHDETPTLLMRSIVTTIEKIIDSMPLFLSQYLEKLLIELSVLISKWSYESADQKLQPFIVKLSSIKQKIGSVIPPRVLIPAVEQSYNKLIDKKCFNATNALMDILAVNLSNLNGPDINYNLPGLTSFFLNALKFRADGNSSLEEANLVEAHIVKSFTVLILKLSENSFRPLYYKLFDFAVRSEMKSERLITFYNLSCSIAQSLRSLFVLFAGHFLNNAAQTLDLCNSLKNEELYFDEDSKNILLLECILKTLNAVFLFDDKKFINKERFDVLMQPLVDQLENDLGTTDDLLKRNKDVLTPCIVNFAFATADDALWKQMNYQILLKMRNNLPHVRLITLHCFTEIVKKLGEDYLPLLPETIPFLAELLEDEEENVENACQKAVREMEKVLGEPLQKYF